MRTKEIVIERVVISAGVEWEPWMFDFARDLVRHQGNVTKAIQASSVSRTTIYTKRSEVSEFGLLWDAIREGFKLSRTEQDQTGEIHGWQKGDDRECRMTK